MRMKTKFYALLVAALMLCNVFVANATRLYLIGTSTEAGWSLNLMDMMVEENGSYVWVGDLTDGSLKFMFTNMSFGDSYGPAVNGAGLEAGTIALGLNSNGTDNQFAVKAGRYSLTVTPGENPTIVVADGTGMESKRIAAADIYPETLYAVGNATEAGWTPANAIEMKETGWGKYAGILTVKAGENLEMKFLAQKDWGTQYGPQNDGEEVKTAGEYSFVKAAAGDPKYHTNFAADAKFSVSLDIAAGKMSLVPYKITTMWLIGEAVGGYNFDDNAQAMTLTEQDSVFTWTGDLATGTLKFCSIWWGWNDDTFGATADNTELAAGSLAIMALDGWGIDYKFNVTTAGNYTLTLDLKAMTLGVVANTTPTANMDVEQTAALVKTLRNGKVVIFRDGVTYDLLGNIVY